MATGVEKLMNLGIVAKLSVLIKMHTLVGTVARGMLVQEVFEPLKRGSFGDMGVTMFALGEMISDKNPCGFNIETNMTRSSLIILGFCARGEGGDLDVAVWQPSWWC